MNKQLIAITVAAALMVPMASHAVDATLYGSIRAGLVSGDDDLPNSGRNLDLGATGTDGDLNEQGLYSRIGVKGSSDLGNGMTAGLHLERGVGSTLSTRHTNVWISGGFGKLTFGQQDNPYRQARNWDQAFFLGGQYGFGDGGSRLEGIRYDMSNGPFKLAVMATANDNQTDSAACTATAACTTDRTAVHGVTHTHASRARAEYDDSVDSWVIAAGYNFGIVNLNVAHRTNNTDIEVPALTSAGMQTNAGDADEAAMIAADRTTAIIEAEKAVDMLEYGTPAARAAGDDGIIGRISDNTAIGLNGSLGAVSWYLSYQTSSHNASNHENDVDSVGGFLSFKPSENDTLYFEYVSHSADRETRAGTNGAVHIGESPTETIFGYSRKFGAGVSFHAEYLSIDKDLPSGADDGSDPSTLVLAMRVDF